MSLERRNAISPYEVVIKNVPAQWIASLRTVIPTYAHVGSLYPEIYGQLGSRGGGLPFATWHDEGYKESDVDAEAGVFLSEPVDVSGRVHVRQLPAATVASLTHHGAYRSLNQAYNAVLQWIEAHGYRVVGPIREIYVHLREPVSQDDESYITELQVPVARVERLS